MTLVKMNNAIDKSINGLINEWFNEFPVKGIKENGFYFPPVNIVEKATGYDLELSVPGWDKSDFSVKLDGNILTVAAEKKEKTAEKTGKIIRNEFSHKSFKRSFTVDDKIDTANIAAKYENGILSLELPKKEEIKNTATQITIQ